MNYIRRRRRRKRRAREEQDVDNRPRPDRQIVRFRDGYQLILHQEILKYYRSIVAQVEAGKNKRSKS